MAKILVADDNSNIQKMVGLALKDEGIEVVAVGNGEAAVRKISDVRPDLVLADVFMPVRNGYEVCQYVKMDSALSHIPVILLVGAFDPLDEQEAQRVGADGVLKKPFIPPDPLISMVKSALQRAGVPHGGAPTTKAAEPGALSGSDLLTPAGGNAPSVSATPAPTFHESPSPVATNESFVEEVPVPARPEPIRIDSGSQPVAFGSLLETPAQEPEEEFASSTPPEFTMERDWRDKDEEVEVEEEGEEEPAAWRPAGQEQEEEASAAKSKKSKSSTSDWRMGGFEQIAANKSRNTWEPEEEKPEVVEKAPAASIRAPEKPAAPAAPAQETPTAVPVPVKPFGTDTWAPRVQSIAPEKTAAESKTVVEDKTAATPAQKPPAEKKETKEGKDSWFSVSSSPWDAEMRKASQLASTWDSPTTAKVPTAPANGTDKILENVSEETKAVIEEAALPPAAVEAIREEAAQVADDAELIVEEPEAASSGGAGFYAKEEEGVLEPNSPPPAGSSMDDLVAKVLAKMNPEMLQAVTREILKPVVEAMVKEELKSKKQ